MNKLLIIVLLIIATVLLGGPFLSGKIAEKETVDALQAFNQKASFGSNELISFDRGYSSSKAKLRYAAPSFLDKKGKHTYDYNCDVKHKVIGVKYQCTLDQSGDYGEFVKQYLNGKDPLSFGVSASATGAVNYEFEIEPFTAKTEGNELISFKQASINIETDKDFSKIVYEYDLDGGSIKDKEGLMIIGKINAEGSFKKLDGLMFLGNGTAQFDSISITSPKEKFTMNDMKIDVDQDEAGDTIDTKFNVTINSADSHKEIGKIEDIKFNFDWLGVNRQALMDYTKAIQDIQSSALSAAAAGDTSFGNQMQGKSMALIPIIEKLLSKDSSLNVNLSADILNDKNSFDLRLKLLDSLTMADSMMFAFAPKEALKKIDLKLKSSIRKSLINKTPQMAIISSNPLFMESKKAYEMDLILGEDISLNGKSMSVEQLQSMVMSATIR